MKRLELPAPPRDLSGPVKAWSQPVTLPTYEPRPADRNPMFLDRRVYQGSSGRVYPLPFIDRIQDEPVDRVWRAVHLENEYLRVMVLPDLGGRIHLLRDLSTGYDLIYRQDVIKPALVGLAGPWVSGGIEFNWPQHHRPATCMPTEVFLETCEDGSRVAWFSDHDPMNRLKGMHGVCLRPGVARMDLKVRLYNRTPLVQTFLWWANAAVEVHEDYQSFFPPDVHLVADHARRAVSTFPRCDGRYYGVDYGRRAREGVPPEERPKRFRPRPGRPPDDLSWYANIPVPTSYMVMGSQGGFVGGYDHAAGIGFVHLADPRIAPGKKQWTWGNHDFGYAWDRNLTEPDERGVYRPYIEIMAGVYTDNQPDFSFLGPGETRTFTQAWFPLHRIGPVKEANLEAALSLSVRPGEAVVGVAVAIPIERASVRVSLASREIARFDRALRPGLPVLEKVALPPGTIETDLRAALLDATGREVISYRPVGPAAPGAPLLASEPPPPEEVASADELYVTGLHLEQYRHATRSAESYWREALRRDPLDSRCNSALGFLHLRRGDFSKAEGHFRKALKRLELHNLNPYDGEPSYGLGLVLRYLGRDAEAYAAFSKSTWNAAWVSASHHALAEIDGARENWPAALEHLDRALRHDSDNLRARDLRAMVLVRLGRSAEAERALLETLSLDPLDAWGRHLAGRTPRDARLALDLALDHARAGLFREALALAEIPELEGAAGATPLLHYHAACFAERVGDLASALRHREEARLSPPDYCFPSRLEDIFALEAAIEANPRDARAPYYLGDLFYDRGRREEAIVLWERAAESDPSYSVVWRNLGIAYFNVRRDKRRALEAYERAFAADPRDARLLYERDQLWKRTAVAPQERLAELSRYPELLTLRDDLTVEWCALLIGADRAEEALARLTSRRFQPWEGGEGLVLGEYTRAHLWLGHRGLERGDAEEGRRHFEAALSPPETLGEAKHPLANVSDVLFALGEACARAGDPDSARRHFTAAAEWRGDFQSMSVRSYSEMTYFSALALARLGRDDEAETLLVGLERHALALLEAEASVPYFATSLPEMLLFEDDLRLRQRLAARVMLCEVDLARHREKRAREGLRAVLGEDPNHALASDLLRGLQGRRAVGG
ncbi:MAG TPA: DUF5107 domain-containing protein [Anaeromyxobacteraceae bacterium]|nr:DUF5107 domain-containing protein [Anaeromyxobacteraceae bacterium]